MNDSLNFHQHSLRCYKPRFLQRNLNNAIKHKTRSKNDPFICGLHSPENYKCRKCQFQFDCKVLLTKHFNTVHKANETEHYPIPDLRYCENCDFQSYSSLVLLRHNSSCSRNGNTFLEYIKIKSEHDEDVATRCPANINKLLGHEEGRGRGLPSQLNQKKITRFECDLCSYKSIQRKCLKEHILSMHPTLKEINWFKCAHCPYKTPHKSYLKRHLHSIHSTSDQITWFTCAHCSYKAKQKNNLHRHVFTQHRETLTLRPKMYFKCGQWQCPYKTTHIPNLKLHMERRHTPPKQTILIKCEYCSYEAMGKQNMFQHMLGLHPKVLDPENRKYTKCEQCCATLIKHNLKQHMERIHPAIDQINWLQCEHCSHKAKSKRCLDHHLVLRHPDIVKTKKL